MGTHYWIRGARQRDRERCREALELPPVLVVANAHRRLRGPYTAAGTVLRTIGADLLRRTPELGPRHHIEILTAAPEFAGKVPPIRATLELTGLSGIRTRYQARVHSARIAHGLVDLLRDYLAALDDGPRAVVLDNVHHADPTDRELIALLLTRLSPDQLTVVVGTDTGTLTDPPGPVAVSLPEALAAWSAAVDAEPSPVPEPVVTAASAAEHARAYVDSDGVSEDPRHRAGYESLPMDERAALHDRRAAELTARGEPSLLLGAVPYHAARGSDPAGAGAAAVRHAQLSCKGRGLYHAAVEFGELGRELVDRESDPELWWDITGDMTTSLAAAGRADEAEACYDELRTLTSDPELHMHIAYGTAMLYARHYPEGRRDPRRARALLNLAVALASQLPDPAMRAFYTVFNQNGLALVEVREGRFDEAVRLLDEGMARLDRELAPDEYLLHRTGLRYNRAQVGMITGRLEEALADFNEVIERDPNFHDHYFNRGNILSRLGRHEEAVADYHQALALSPPFPEAYYNRADAWLELGDEDRALADFGRVLELDPTNVDARVNRAGILLEREDLEAARAEITAGLAIAPDNPHLRCLQGRLLAEQGETEAAQAALTAALRLDDQLAEAYAIRGGLAFEAGDQQAAIDDLTMAVELSDDPDLRFNRAVVYEAAGRHAEAVADYDVVVAATDDPQVRQRRAACLASATASRGA